MATREAAVQASRLILTTRSSLESNSSIYIRSVDFKVCTIYSPGHFGHVSQMVQLRGVWLFRKLI